jgi:hypothetical protein
MTRRPVTYPRPVEATLHVHLANGDTWEATSADLDKFGLVNPHDAYAVFENTLGEILAQAGLIRADITEARLNAVRYLVETAIVNPGLIDHPEYRGWPDVVALERAVQSAHLDPVDVEDALGAFDMDAPDETVANIARYLTERMSGKLAERTGVPT